MPARKKGTVAPKATKAAATKVATIVVNTKNANAAKFRGARASWLTAIQGYHNKPLQTFVTAMAANPPTKPKTGKYAKTGEPPMGWVRFFVRQQIVSIANK